MAKCSITPIYGGHENLDDIVSILGCQVQPFPIKYLGLPLSIKKNRKSTGAVRCRGSSKEASPLPWLPYGAERTTGVDQVSTASCPYLRDDG